MKFSKNPNLRRNRNSVAVAFDLRIVSLALLAVIIGMLLLWQPWQAAAGANERTVTVTGSATVKAEPDEYVFYPMYEFTNPDRDAAIAAAAKKSAEITARLKTLGVRDVQIKSSTYGNDNSYRRSHTQPTEGRGEETAYMLRMTITVGSRELAQKVQDYIATTSPSGSVSPQPAFSETKRKQLESQARDAATKEARSKAEQSAKNLGFSIGEVKSVDDDSGFGIKPMYGRDAIEPAEGPDSSLEVQPGENELDYSVTVTYYVE